MSQEKKKTHSLDANSNIEEDVYSQEKMRREMADMKRQREKDSIAIGNYQKVIEAMNDERKQIGEAVHVLKESVLGMKQLRVPITARDTVEVMRSACTILVAQRMGNIGMQNQLLTMTNGVHGAGQVMNGLQLQLHGERMKNAQLTKEKTQLEGQLMDMQRRLKTALEKIVHLEKTAETSRIIYQRDLKDALEKRENLEKTAETYGIAYQKELEDALERIENLVKIADTYQKDLGCALVKVEIMENAAETSRIDLEIASEKIGILSDTAENCRKHLEVALEKIECLEKSEEASKLAYEKELKASWEKSENIEKSAETTQLVYQKTLQPIFEKIEFLERTADSFQMFYERDVNAASAKISELETSEKDYQKRLNDALKKIEILELTEQTSKIIYQKGLKEAWEKNEKLKEIAETSQLVYQKEHLPKDFEKMRKCFLSNSQGREDLKKMLIGNESSERLEGSTVYSEPGLLKKISTDLENLMIELFLHETIDSHITCGSGRDGREMREAERPRKRARRDEREERNEEKGSSNSDDQSVTSDE